MLCHRINQQNARIYPWISVSLMQSVISYPNHNTPHVRLLSFARDDVEALPIIHSRSTLSFIRIDAGDIRLVFSFLTWDVRAIPPRIGKWEKGSLRHDIQHRLPFLLGLLFGLDDLHFLILEFLDHVDDSFNLALNDGGAIRQSCGCLWGVRHEHIWEAIDRESQISRHAVLPNVFERNAIFVLEAHVRQGASERIESRRQDYAVKFMKLVVRHDHALLSKRF